MPSNESANGGPVLAEYHAIASQLADAEAKVEAIHAETASLTATRDAVYHSFPAHP